MTTYTATAPPDGDAVTTADAAHGGANRKRACGSCFSSRHTTVSASASQPS